MFLNRYVLALVITSLASLVSFIVVITRLNPFTDEQVALPLFFASLFFLLSSFLCLLGYFLRVFFYRHELFLNHFNVSLRQGIILSLGICLLMGLQVMRTLTWWNGLLVLAITFLVEIYFVARE